MKIKKLLSLVLTVMLIVCAVPMGAFNLTASAATSGYYTYIISDGKATITDCDISISGDVTIPRVLGRYPVTSIGDSAFFNCSNITSIIIPNSVTSIGENAFSYCTQLKSITIPEGITSIGDEFFTNCSSLTSVNIPDSVTCIGNWAFFGCSSLTSITIPDSVTSIGYDAFERCTSLTNITIPNSVTSIGMDAFCDCTSLTSIIIPDSVTSIEYGVFYGCSSLTSITIPNSVTSIGSYAFYNCSSLTNVYINDIAAWCNIDFIDFYSTPMYYANNLYLNGELITNITIPDGITGIGDYAFYYCRSLTSINIPDSVTSIGTSSFFFCTELTDITIPDGVTAIGDKAFYNCNSLTSIKIPNSVTSIGERAFSSCTSLETVYYYCGTEEQWNEISIGASNTQLVQATRYYHDYSELESNCTEEIKQGVCSICGEIGTENIPVVHNFVNGVCIECKVISESMLTYTVSDGKATITDCNTSIGGDVTIPSTLGGYPVTSIGGWAFSSCTSLTSITIPDSVNSIGIYAFYKCNGLEKIYFKGTAEEWAAVTIGSGNDSLKKATVYFGVAKDPDLDGDGNINSRDIVIIRKELIKNTDDLKYDINGDDTIDVRDLINIKKQSAGIL